MSQSATDPWTAFRRNPVEATFQPIYDQTNALAYTICYRVLRNEEDARDAFQSTYARLVALAKEAKMGVTAEGGTCAEDEIAGIVRRLAAREADSLRHRRKRRQAREIGVADYPAIGDSAPRADETAMRRERLCKMESLIGELPELYRTPILLHYFQGMNLREISEALGRPLSTISTQIARGLKKLEPEFRKAGLGEAAVGLAALIGAVELLSPPASLTAAVIFGAAEGMIAAGGIAGGAAAGAAGGVAGLAAWKATLAGAILTTKGGAFAAGISLGVLVFVAVAFTRLNHEPAKQAAPEMTQAQVSSMPQMSALNDEFGSNEVGSIDDPRERERNVAQAAPVSSAPSSQSSNTSPKKAQDEENDLTTANYRPTPPKLGVLFSARTVHGKPPSYGTTFYANTGYYLPQLTAMAYQGMGFDLYAVIEPGSEKDSDLQDVLRQCGLTERIINGADREALKQIEGLGAAMIYNVDERVLEAVYAAVQGGMGFVCLGGFGYNAPGNSDILEDLVGMSQTPENYRMYTQKLACPVVAPEEMRIGVLSSISEITIQGETYGFTGVVDGTPLVTLPPEVDDSLSLTFIRQCGKGRVVVMQGFAGTITGAQALTFVRLIAYITNWACHRKMDIQWKPLNLKEMLGRAGVSTPAPAVAKDDAPTTEPPLKMGLILSHLDNERPDFGLFSFNPAVYPTALKTLSMVMPTQNIDFYAIFDQGAREDKMTEELISVAGIPDDHILDPSDSAGIKKLNVILSIYNPDLSEELLASVLDAVRGGTGFISIGKIGGQTPEAGAALEAIIGLAADADKLRYVDGEFELKLLDVPQAAGILPTAKGYKALKIFGYAGDVGKAEGTPILAWASGGQAEVCPAYIRRIGYGRVLVCQFLDLQAEQGETIMNSPLPTMGNMDAVYTAAHWAAGRERAK